MSKLLKCDFVQPNWNENIFVTFHENKFIWLLNIKKKESITIVVIILFEVEFDCFVTQKNWLYQGFHDPWSSPDLIGRPQSENSFLKCDFICLFQMNWNEKDQKTFWIHWVIYWNIYFCKMKWSNWGIQNEKKWKWKIEQKCVLNESSFALILLYIA